MKPQGSFIVAVLVAVAVTMPATGVAHHGFGDYDPSKLVSLTGTVVRFANENPHASVVIRVDGEEWFCLLPSADGLVRRAIAPATFAPGSRVALKGYLHRKEPRHMRPEWLVTNGVEQSLRDARPPLPGESAEDWVLLGTKLHGGFGSYIALGVHIGLDARERLGAPPRSYDVTLQNGKAAPCACLADGLQLSTGATPGRGSLRVVSDIAAGDVFAIVTVRERTSGRTLTYTVPGEARELLDQWNKIPAAERLPALRTVPSSELFERVEQTPPPDDGREATSLAGRPLRSRPATPAVEQAVARLNSHPRDVDALLAAGQAHDTVWQFRSAIDAYTRALAVEPTNVRALSYRGQRWISTRQFDKAAADLEQAAQLDPGSFDALYHLGLAYYLRGRFGEAASAFGRCLQAKADGPAQPALGHSPTEARPCGAVSEGLRFALVSWRYAALLRDGRVAEAQATLASAPAVPEGLTDGRYYAQAVELLRRSPATAIDQPLPSGTAALTLGYPLANAAFVLGDRSKACVALRDLAARDDWPAFGLIAAEADLARGACREEIAGIGTRPVSGRGAADERHGRTQ